MVVMAVHQFAQCITCHAWSADQSSNYCISLFKLFYFFGLDSDKFTVSRENRARLSLFLLPILGNWIRRWFEFDMFCSSMESGIFWFCRCDVDWIWFFVLFWVFFFNLKSNGGCGLWKLETFCTKIIRWRSW